MAYNLFLSHDHRDEPLAKALAGLLERLSLSQLRIWFSSDASPGGGIKPGSVWIDEIRSQLQRSKAILALLTPRSVERPWLLFESGFGAGLSEGEVIPVCIGLGSTSDIPFPLAIYQSFILTDLESLERFTGKLLARYGIPFDEEMMKPVLRRAISDFTKTAPSAGETKEQKRELSTQELLDAIKLHLDRRIGEIAITLKEPHDQVDPESLADTKPLHEVPLYFKFPDLAESQYNLVIDSESSVQDILDKVYYVLVPRVGSFKYLSQWIMRERSSGLRLVIREIAHLVPALSIFRVGTSWEVAPLEQAYRIEDSGDPETWYRKNLFDSEHTTTSQRSTQSRRKSR